MALRLAWTDERSRRRRVVFEQRDAGGWVRRTEILEEGGWRTTGEEIVADPALDVDGSIISISDSEASGGVSTVGS